MKKYRLIFILSAVLLASSCSNNFLDLKPSNKVPTKNLYKTASDFDIAIMGCYAKLQTQVSFSIECCEYRSDNIYLSAPTTGTQDRYDFDQFKDKPSNGILQDCWANFNNGVYRCNLVLDRIDGASFDQKLKNQYKAEAMFIRAFTYFNMYRAWGGVPTTRKVVTVAEGLKIGRSTPEQMYQFIAGDLKQIIDENLLPATYTGAGVGRITIGAARALLGKVYLTFKKYPEARDILAPMITDKTYGLMDNIDEVFDVNKKMNKEIIFAVRFAKDIVDEGHGYWYSIPNLKDDNQQTQALTDCYNPKKGDDARVEMITYVKTGKVCLMNKFMDTADPSTNNVGNDQIILRYADVLLMYAEALNEIGYSASQESEQLKALNAVHTRSVESDVIDISTLPNQRNFRKAIMLERQREFPYEGHRWFDLIRMGGALEAIAAQGHEITESQLLFPIPKTELERVNNTSLLWQNPGY